VNNEEGCLYSSECGMMLAEVYATNQSCKSHKPSVVETFSVRSPGNESISTINRAFFINMLKKVTFPSPEKKDVKSHPVSHRVPELFSLAAPLG
jgi:hypothetical protein